MPYEVREVRVLNLTGELMNVDTARSFMTHSEKYHYSARS